MKFKTLLLSIFIFQSLIYAQDNIDQTYHDASYKLVKNDTNTNGNEFINIISYNFKRLQILPEQKLIRAKVNISINPTLNLNSFYLDFHNTYKILSLKINDTIAEWKFDHGNNLYIKPKKPLKKNTIFDVEISYYNTSEIAELWENSIFEDDFIFSELPNYLLFPSNEVFGDRVNFTINTSIPRDYKIVSFGSISPNGVNKYTIKSSSGISVNNFTLNLIKGYSKFSIKGPKISFGALSDRVIINQYTPIDSTIVFKDVISYIPKQLTFLDSILGYYPYRTFNVLISKDIIRHGVSNSRSTIIIPYAYTVDSTEVRNKILNGLIKQWYGNKVNATEENDAWITKGISKYIEWILVEQKVGKVEFNKMMNSKLVEARKYMGLIDWHNMNPKPIYTYDLNNAVYNFGELSKTKIIKGDDISFLFNVISLDTTTVSDSIKISFKNKFGHDISKRCKSGHSYHELMLWAKEQGRGHFRISTDGFYTLKSMQDNKFKTHVFKLAKAGEYKNDITLEMRAALFIHFLRIYLGDEIFFQKTLEFATTYSEVSLSADFFLNQLNKDTNREIIDQINTWLYSETEIPAFIQKKELETITIEE